jgi:hypothetical protein
MDLVQRTIAELEAVGLGASADMARGGGRGADADEASRGSKSIQNRRHGSIAALTLTLTLTLTSWTHRSNQTISQAATNAKPGAPPRLL